MNYIRVGANMTSTRYEGDTWDLASSVGVTATRVAAAGAVATRADRPLIDDPFAEPLVRAVGVDLLTRLSTGEMAPDDLVGQVWIGPGQVRTKWSRPNPQPGDEDKARARLHRISEHWRAHGFDTGMARLRYLGERHE